MLIKIKEVAGMLSMNQTSIYKLVYRKAIPYIKIGGALRFDRDKIIAWINQNSYDMINPKSKRL
ncbi:MAG: helix-turn-helix domain-containing protein [Deltaproteobacteria bacterium]|jgi:excisionase family DNA binding protein|nr:helix-turn-helix domain-containing protein [Deltaproteobacteria bacterium]